MTIRLIGRSAVRALRRSFVGSVLAAVAATQSVGAWTQLYNNYPNDPVSCNNVGSWQCIEWPLAPNGFSSTVYVYLSSTLTQANLNLQTDIRNSEPLWDAAPARNPFLRNVSSPDQATAVLSRGTTVFSSSWAETTQTIAGNGHTIIFAGVVYNKNVTWNRNFQYGPLVADSRKVSTHELGHVEALGHTGFNTPMKQGAVNLWQPQQDDYDGLVAIYGAA